MYPLGSIVKMPRMVKTIGEKIQAIEDLERGLPNKEVSAKHGISKSTLSTWVKNKHKLKAAFKKGKTDNMRIREDTYRLINGAVLEWYFEMRDQNIPLSGSMVKKRALECAKEFNLDSFKASDSWLYSWKLKNNVSLARSPRTYIYPSSSSSSPSSVNGSSNDNPTGVFCKTVFSGMMSKRMDTSISPKTPTFQNGMYIMYDLTENALGISGENQNFSDNHKPNQVAVISSPHDSTEHTSSVNAEMQPMMSAEVDSITNENVKPTILVDDSESQQVLCPCRDELYHAIDTLKRFSLHADDENCGTYSCVKNIETQN